MRASLVLVAASLGVSLVPSAGAAGDGPAVLPLRSVVLYESGVGYFERRGPVRRGADLGLLVPENHLDDALMTLVVLTPDGARVASFACPGVLAPEMAETESSAEIQDFEQGDPLGSLLGGLAGIETTLVAGGDTYRGRVVGTARIPEIAPPGVDVASGADRAEHPPAEPGTIEVPVLVFLTGEGALRWFRLEEIERVGPEDGATQDALERAVAGRSPRRGEVQATVDVDVRESGELALGYLAEAAVWRISYRTLIRDGQARIQGWALVHNDTDEDWEGVSLELVEGEPSSFLFPFVTPRFLHRQVVPAEDDLELVAQLAGTNADELSEGRGRGGGRMGRGRSGERSGPDLTGRTGRAPDLGLEDVVPSPLISFADSAAAVAAEPEQRRELLSYRATEPLFLAAHESALVPVIDAAISAERVTLVGPEPGSAVSAIRIRNDTGYALRGGPLAIYETGFSGETWLPRMFVGDARLLPHGNDVDVTAFLVGGRTEREVRAVRWSRTEHWRSDARLFVTERLEEHYVSRVRHSWVIRSHAATDRVVLVGVPDLMNGRVASPDGAERLTTEDGAEREFVPVLLPAGGEVGTEVVTEEGLMEVWHPDGISSAVLHDIAGASGLDDGTRARLQEAEAAFEEDERQRPLAWGKQQEISATSSEILRYRGDLQALAGAGADEDVATDIGWRLVEAGRRLDRLVDEAVRATQAAAAARQRGLTILRTLATGQAQLSTSAAGGGGRSRRLRSPRPRSRTSSAPRRSRRSSTPARRGSDPR